MSDMETCGNCGHRIGKLEEAHFWKEHVVCSACKDVLARQAKTKSRPPSASTVSSHSKVGASVGSSSASGAAVKLTPMPGDLDIKLKSDDEVVSPVAESFPSAAEAEVPTRRTSSSSSSRARSGSHHS